MIGVRLIVKFKLDEQATATEDNVEQAAEQSRGQCVVGSTQDSRWAAIDAQWEHSIRGSTGNCNWSGRQNSA